MMAHLRILLGGLS